MIRKSTKFVYSQDNDLPLYVTTRGNVVYLTADEAIALCEYILDIKLFLKKHTNTLDYIQYNKDIGEL